MSADHDLAETLTSTLATKATQVEVTVGEFDPTRAGAPPALVALDRRRPRVLLPAAAVVAAVALVGAAVALSGGHDGSTSDSAAASDTSTAAQGDGPWLVPTWVPEGLALRSIDREVVAPEDETDGGELSTRQLFGDPDAGRALYVHVRRQPEGEYRGTAQPTEIRGLPGWYAVGGLSEGTSWIMWRERGAETRVQIRGLSRDEAVAAIESLEWRSDDPLEGFAPPQDDTLPLRAETGIRRPSQTVHLVYGDGSPAGGEAISVYTKTNDGYPVHYLDAWFDEGGDVTVDADGARHVFEPDVDTLTVHWPDGRYVRVSPLDPMATVDRAVLARVARSVRPADRSELDALQGEMEANVAETPVIAAAETPIGTLELHGSGALRHLCLRRPDAAALDCGRTPMWATAGSEAGPGAIAGPTSWVVDGTWYVAVASTGFDTEIGDGGSLPEGDPLPTTDTRADGWLLRLAEVPADVDEVYAAHDEEGASDVDLRPYVTAERPS